MQRVKRMIGRAFLATVPAALFLVMALNAGSAQAAPGQEPFEMYCAVCHGMDGTAILPNAPHFAKGERLEKTDEQLAVSISDGLNNVMPPWKGVLTPEQISELMVYIRTLVK